MRKFIFTSFVVGYALIASVVMIPISILNGLFGLYFHFIAQLYHGVRDFHEQIDVEEGKKNKPFSWEDYALEREKANAKTEEDK